MATVKGRRSLWPMLGLFALLLASLYLLSAAMQNSAQFGRLYSWLLLVNSLALVLLTALIGSNLYSLVRQYRTGVAGSRLTLRLVVLFIVLAVVPVTIVYSFSIQFLQRGIDSWFDVQLEQALDDALTLSRSALDQRMRERLRESQSIAAELSDVSKALLPLSLNDMRVRTEATEITLLGGNGQVLAASSADPSSSLMPHRPTDSIMLQLTQGHPYVGLDPIGELGLHIRTVVRVPSPTAAEGERVLQILYPVAERLNALADGVQGGVARYKELMYLRGPLKQSFVLTLSLVLLLSLLAAVWAAFYSARRLVAPIRELAEGTQAVAEGHYDKQLAPAGKDELGFLVHSFNTMTRKLAAARDAASRSQRQAENQRAYLEVVLSRLSSGVLTLDRRGMLRTVNTAASQILGPDLNACLGHRFSELASEHPHLQRFIDALWPHLEGGEGEWREEVVLFGTAGRQVLMCRGSTLPGHRGKAGGHVIVFDDITALIQAQRDAAWAEVARRLAHEIKNPLTPIQLSAERLRHKYLEGRGSTDTSVLDRATHTIVEQVKAMKGMVNAFSQYARPAELALESVDLNAIVDEVLELYRSGQQGARVEFVAQTDLPAIEADAGRLRQLLHNLIKNAIEAAGNDVRLTLRSRALEEHGWRFVELVIEDNGPGFSADVLGQLFEPYVTTKTKGTGLGLAIVKKIVEEHGGTIWAENLDGGGARLVIRLPSAETQALPVQPSVGSERG